MTQRYFTELAGFNMWANNIVCGWMAQLSDAHWQQHIVSSFNSIEQTTLHIASAEQAWLERFQGKQDIVWQQPVFKGTKAEVVSFWNTASQGLYDFISTFDESRLQEHLHFKRLNGEPYSMPWYQLFAHVINHSTYHRGQLVTMLRQAGFEGTGSTDLLLYFRTSIEH